MPASLATISCNLDTALLQAAYPLFANGEVEAIEWSFDTLYAHRHIPDWFLQLLRTYGDAERLVGHGVYYSLFSGCWSADQQAWLEALRKKCAHFRFDHISEHFGFMTGTDFHQGAPLGVPYNAATLAIGRDRLLRMSDACRRPVGLENLAFAYRLDAVQRHGEFLNALLEPVDGFIILDLHNLYCQLHNFSVEADTLLAAYPLERVRELHLSGGSWSDTPAGVRVRRDTHDDGVPDAVFDLLETVLPRCPQLRYVTLEQLGAGLQQPAQRTRFAEDFRRMRRIIHAAPAPTATPRSFLPAAPPAPSAAPLESAELHAQQRALARILETAPNARAAATALAASPLADTDWDYQNWKPAMLETALAIAQKWKKGHAGV